MPECIFCDSEVPDDCEECPECSLPPFSGMMFDPKTKEEADRLESEGDSLGAWEILIQEWRNHTDVDYYDDEMAFEIKGWIEGLFSRNPELVEERIKIKLDEMRVCHYQGDHNGGIDAAEDAIQLAKDAERPELEIEALDAHMSIQHSRYGGRNYPEIEKLTERREELRRITGE